MKYIDADKLIAEIRRIVEEETPISKGADYYHGVADAADKLLSFITSLQQEQPDKYEIALEKAREWMPNINQGGHAMLIDIFPELGEGLDPRYGSRKQEQPDYKEAVQLVFEEELTPYKDGNQWCFLLGRNIQDGICGFGDTILDAAINFYKDYSTTRIHIGELKKTMAQPEVDLEKE